MYEVITEAYHSNNARVNKENKNKKYEYVILNKDFQSTEKTGVCTDVKMDYDPCYDYNFVSFTDINNGKRYNVCEFYVELKETKTDK